MILAEIEASLTDNAKRYLLGSRDVPAKYVPCFREKHISADHSIVYTGAPPRLAYYKREQLPKSAVYEQVLPKREDHPELPTNTPTIEMHRPEALRKMRRSRQERLEAAAARGEPHAIRELAEKRERERQQLLKERRRRALRKAVFMRGLKRMTKSGVSDEKYETVPKMGPRASAAIPSALPCSRSVSCSSVHTCTESGTNTGTTMTGSLRTVWTKTGVLSFATKILKTITPVACAAQSIVSTRHLKEHEVIWAPKTAKQVLAEEPCSTV